MQSDMHISFALNSILVSFNLYFQLNIARNAIIPFKFEDVEKKLVLLPRELGLGCQIQCLTKQENTTNSSRV